MEQRRPRCIYKSRRCTLWTLHRIDYCYMCLQYRRKISDIETPASRRGIFRWQAKKVRPREARLTFRRKEVIQHFPSSLSHWSRSSVRVQFTLNLPLSHRTRDGESVHRFPLFFSLRYFCRLQFSQNETCSRSIVHSTCLCIERPCEIACYSVVNAYRTIHAYSDVHSPADSSGLEGEFFIHLLSSNWSTFLILGEIL